MSTFGHVIGGSLLVSGVTLGVGMPELPIATSQAGFAPSLLLLLGAWAIMLSTGLLVLEACIWMPKHANLSSLSFHLLGKWAGSVAWAVFLGLFLCLLGTQVASAGGILASIVPGWAANLLYVVLFAPAVFLGIRWVDRLNILLLAGLAASLILFSFAATNYITPTFLMRAQWDKTGAALPAVLGCFAFQSLIPTLFNYMNRNVKKVRFALIAGTTIPLAIYAIWQFLILGTISAQGLKNAQMVSYIQNPAVLAIGKAIVFFAISASFVGIALAFADFLLDGVKKKKKSRALVCSAIFLSALVMSQFNLPWKGIGLLFGALPVMMVWAGRYAKGYSRYHQQLPGGRITLSLLLVFFLFSLLKLT